MTTISPTRVSMYDFLYQDTQPLVSLLADAAHLSLPQTRLALVASLQAIISALLSYQQTHQGQAVSKKLFHRGAVKELREYNAMNFTTIDATLYTRNDVADVVFGDMSRVASACTYIAEQIDATPKRVKTLLTCLCVVVLRELAILADYSQLDFDEIDKWFELQPQFLSKARFEQNDSAPHPTESAEPATTSTPHSAITPPPFDPYWYQLTGFQPVSGTNGQDITQATPHYLKVIGRSPSNLPEGRHNDLLVFAPMPAIVLPHQRWLLQLAKVSDIYLSRNRLTITSEPEKAPAPPVVSLGLLGGNAEDTKATSSEKPIEYDKPMPIWKNPVILIIIVVIGALGALAALKYQTQQSKGAVSATEAVLEQDHAREQQDVAIVKVDADAAEDSEDKTL